MTYGLGDVVKLRSVLGAGAGGDDGEGSSYNFV